MREARYYYVPGLSDKLQLLNDHTDMGVKEISRKLGCGESAWWSWRVGLTVPNGWYLRNIARTFGVSVDWLLGLKQEEER